MLTIKILSLAIKIAYHIMLFEKYYFYPSNIMYHTQSIPKPTIDNYSFKYAWIVFVKKNCLQ